MVTAQFGLFQPSRDGHPGWLGQLELDGYYTKYAMEQPEEEREQYSFAEIEARAKKLGLWSYPKPYPPWERRRRKKEEA